MPNYTFYYKEIVRGLSSYGKRNQGSLQNSTWQDLSPAKIQSAFLKSLDWVPKRSCGPDVFRKIPQNSQKKTTATACLQPTSLL